MLHIQKALQTQSLETIAKQLGLKFCFHETLPLVILNYNMIDSPKTHPIIRECRGLILHAGTYEVVAKSFDRFFNWGEVQQEQKMFDFTDFITEEKLDGSLVRVFNFQGKWMCATRGSFAQGFMADMQHTWQEHVEEILGASLDEFFRTCELNTVFTFELCGPINKVVRRYKKPSLILIGVCVLDVCPKPVDVNPSDLDRLAKRIGVPRPRAYDFSSIEEISAWLLKNSEKDRTFEGFVIRDKNNQRIKIKSKTYLALHRLSNNGNIFNPKNLVPLVLAGELDELFLYFPEVKPAALKVKATLDKAYEELEETWARGYGISADKKKKYALAVKDSPFSSILFKLRNEFQGEEEEKDLKLMWQASAPLILKQLLKKDKKQ